MTSTNGKRVPQPSGTHLLDDLAFYLLVLLAAIGPPVLEYNGDFVTLFDFYLGMYFIVKLSRSGFSLAGTHWATLFAVFAVYLIYLVFGTLRVLTPFSLLLVLKQFEYVLFLIVLVDRLESSSANTRAQDLWFLLAILLTVIGYQLLYFHGALPGIGDTRRLGLPFMTGTSSNPAGLFLAGTVIVLYYLSAHRLRFLLPSLLVGALALWALALTGSRTNAAALVVALPVSVVATTWHTRSRWYVVAGLLAAGTAFFLLGVDLLSADGVPGRIVRLLQDPVSMLDEPSFTIRRDILWQLGMDTWLRNGWTFLFGAGFGSFDVIDGTIPRVLGEQGIVGLIFFLYVWYLHYLRFERSPVVILVLLFTLINGINAETLVISFRSVQLYLVLLLIGLSSSRKRVAEPVEQTAQVVSFRLPDALGALRSSWFLVPTLALVFPIGAVLIGLPESGITPTGLGIAVYALSGVVVAVVVALLLHLAPRLRVSNNLRDSQ